MLARACLKGLRSGIGLSVCELDGDQRRTVPPSTGGRGRDDHCPREHFFALSASTSDE
jgi:hypothetical protein